MKLKYTGRGFYRGRGVVVKSGSVVDCEPTVAGELLADFPGWFEKVGTRSAPVEEEAEAPKKKKTRTRRASEE